MTALENPKRMAKIVAAGAISSGMVLAAAAFLPVEYAAGDALFQIPKGTWARRMAGDDLEILPSRIQLVAGMTLVLRNLDDVPQILGPTLIMPGQTFRLPFRTAAEYQFVCSAHTSGYMTVVVREAPTSPWGRLRWRARSLAEAFSSADSPGGST